MSDIIIPAVPTKWVEINANIKVISVVTFSGYRSPRHDYQRKDYLFQPPVENKILGKAVLEALDQSRFILPVDDPELYDYKKVADRFQAWVNRMLKFTEVNSKYKLFKEMSNCSVSQENNLIKFRPTNQVKWNAWDGDGFTENDNVVISSDSSPEKVGEAVKLALSRCH